jgi:hypothetical protein
LRFCRWYHGGAQAEEVEEVVMQLHNSLAGSGTPGQGNDGGPAFASNGKAIEEVVQVEQEL